MTARLLWALAVCACAASALANPAQSRQANDAARAYRVIGRALVLKDVRTNLIVDFIPGAMSHVR